jgi:hypothetical protein
MKNSGPPILPQIRDKNKNILLKQPSDYQPLTHGPQKIVPPDGGKSIFDSLYNRGM